MSFVDCKYDLGFIYSNPLSKDVKILDSESELGGVKEGIKTALEFHDDASETRKSVSIISKPANLRVLSQLSLRGCRIIHFSGHVTSAQKMLFENYDFDPKGGLNAVEVPPDTFIATVRNESDEKRSNKIQLIFLSACSSCSVGEELLKFVDYVIACRGGVKQRVSRVFAKAFYFKLYNGASIGASFEHASISSNTGDKKDDDMFVLLSKKDLAIQIQPACSTLSAPLTQSILYENVGEVPSDIFLGKRPMIYGRRSEMYEILQIFTGNKSTDTIVLTVYGPRLIGKTELVKHAAQYLFVRDYISFAVYIPMGQILRHYSPEEPDVIGSSIDDRQVQFLCRIIIHYLKQVSFPVGDEVFDDANEHLIRLLNSNNNKRTLIILDDCDELLYNASEEGSTRSGSVTDADVMMGVTDSDRYYMTSATAANNKSNGIKKTPPMPPNAWLKPPNFSNIPKSNTAGGQPIPNNCIFRFINRLMSKCERKKVGFIVTHSVLPVEGSVKVVPEGRFLQNSSERIIGLRPLSDNSIWNIFVNNIPRGLTNEDVHGYQGEQNPAIQALEGHPGAMCLFVRQLEANLVLSSEKACSKARQCVKDACKPLPREPLVLPSHVLNIPVSTESSSRNINIDPISISNHPKFTFEEALRRAKDAADEHIHDSVCANIWSHVTADINHGTPFSSIPFDILFSKLDDSVHVAVAEGIYNFDTSKQLYKGVVRVNDSVEAIKNKLATLRRLDLRAFSVFLMETGNLLEMNDNLLNAIVSAESAPMPRITLESFKLFSPWWCSLLNTLMHTPLYFGKYNGVYVMDGFLSRASETKLLTSRALSKRAKTIWKQTQQTKQTQFGGLEGVFLIRFSKRQPGKIVVSYTKGFINKEGFVVNRRTGERKKESRRVVQVKNILIEVTGTGEASVIDDEKDVGTNVSPGDRRVHDSLIRLIRNIDGLLYGGEDLIPIDTLFDELSYL